MMKYLHCQSSFTQYNWKEWKVIDIKDKLAEYGLDEKTYEEILKVCSDKVDGLTDSDWQDIIEKYHLSIHYDTLRKASQTIFGGSFVKKYFESKGYSSSEDISNEISEKIRTLESERIKLKTEKIEYNKWLREHSRDELIY